MRFQSTWTIDDILEGKFWPIERAYYGVYGCRKRHKHDRECLKECLHGSTVVHIIQTLLNATPKATILQSDDPKLVRQIKELEAHLQQNDLVRAEAVDHARMLEARIVKLEETLHNVVSDSIDAKLAYWEEKARLEREIECLKKKAG